MQKNLAPIKCAIIENRNRKSSSLILEQKKSDEITNVEPKNNRDERVNLESEIEKVHDQYRTMWRTILKEIQQKKINEIKVILRENYMFM